LAAEAAVGSVEVVVVLPVLELVVEDLGVVDHGSVQEPLELFGVDAVVTGPRQDLADHVHVGGLGTGLGAP
jgi:hypothetical protein